MIQNLLGNAASLSGLDMLDRFYLCSGQNRDMKKNRAEEQKLLLINYRSVLQDLWPKSYKSMQ